MNVRQREKEPVSTFPTTLNLEVERPVTRTHARRYHNFSSIAIGLGGAMETDRVYPDPRTLLHGDTLQYVSHHVREHCEYDYHREIR